MDTYHIGFLDCGTICNWIGEGDTEFNDVCSSFLHREQDRNGVLDLGIAGGHESNQGGTCLRRL